MSTHDVEEWEKETAEVEIRQWLYRTGQWAPGAERLGAQTAEETGPEAGAEEAIAAPPAAAPAVEEQPAPAPVGQVRQIEEPRPQQSWFARFRRWLAGSHDG